MKAGFFEKDVTPARPVFLAGYPSRSKPSDGVDDPLFLRIAALEDSKGERMALVTADLLKFPKDMAWRTKAWCETQLGLKSASVVINLSHTHCAPGLFYQECYPHWALDVDYVRDLELSIREGIAAAIADLQPTRITFGVRQAHFGISRRLPTAELGGKVRLGANEDGYYDPDMPMLAFYGQRDGKLRALLYSYGCHPTSKSGNMVSADYPGELSRALKAALGGEVMTLFAQGAGASVMTRYRCRSDEDKAQYSERWAQVAVDMAAFVRSDAMGQIDLDLHAAEKDFVIPYDQSQIPSVDELLTYAAPDEPPVDRYIRPANRQIIRLWAGGIYEKIRTGSLDAGFTMHAARIALSERVQMVTLSGEVTADVGRMVKDAFPECDTIFLGYCSYTDAYIPTAKMLPEEGHEALASIWFHMRPAPFVAEIDSIITRELTSLGS